MPDIEVTLGKYNKTINTINKNTLFDKGLRDSFGVAARYKITDSVGNEEKRIQYIAQTPFSYIDKLNQTVINEGRMVYWRFV